ncbi:MAG: hypothetical protein F6K42_24335 [Leptolyngbya sp. SIO1D8]|nr:hypothetical protein [Leptolyngbya sp. SIO1D8]
MAEIRKQLPEVPKTTLYDWSKEFRNGVEIAKRSPLPLDPDSEIVKIRRALWEVVRGDIDPNPIVVRALDSLIRLVQIEADLAPDEPQEDSELTINVNRRLIKPST